MGTKRHSNGFSLAELAIVMVLVGIVLSMGLKMVTSTLENAAYSETKSKQERIKTALIGYLRTNGNLPCPDNSAGVATGNAASPCKAADTNGFGVVPWITLGLSREDVTDGWGNFFTYRVSTSNPVPGKNWTEKAAPGADLTINELKTPTQALTIRNLDNTGTALADLTTVAVVAIISHGKNGFGAKTTRVAARIPTTDAGPSEITNATANSSIYVQRPVSDSPGGLGIYDDLLAYMTPADLLQPLITEGTLKTCYAYCATTPSCSSSGAFSCSAGTGFCVSSGPNCTSSGTPTCSVGIPQCIPPGIGCTPATIPIGATPATCL